MIASWMRRKDGHSENNPDLEILIPDDFRCPISLDLMIDPVILSSGITYDRVYIEKWFRAGKFTCPVTNQALKNFDHIRNNTLRHMIQEWCVKNRYNGAKGIPTPKVHITTIEVSDIFYNIQASSSRLDQHKCLEWIQMIEKRCSESEWNILCMIDNRAANVLGVAFDVFANESYEKNNMILEKILSALNWIFPIGAENRTSLVSKASLRCMVWFLNSTDVTAKKHAILVLQEVSSDKHVNETLRDIEGVHETLFKLIKNKICPIITKASLKVTFDLVSLSSCSEKIGSKFAEMGLVSLLVEILVDSNKSLCEKALGVLDRICCGKKGMQEAYNNDLIMPVLAKKILRVSGLATEFSVSLIWRLCKNEEKSDEVKAATEALQFGAFQKLVLLLQVGCDQKTKENATQLLKLLNPLRPGQECIDSIDFKNLSRTF